MRTPIQLAAIPSAAGTLETLVALCEDGSMWYMSNPFYPALRHEWVRLPDLPEEGSASWESLGRRRPRVRQE
jgi:hypothetical protein